MTMAANSRQRKTAVISGGAGGLGAALSEALQAEDWRVVLIDINVAHMVPSETQWLLQCDITDATALRETCKQVIDDCDSIDLVIYAAGVTAIAPVDALEEHGHRKLFEINYFAAVAMARAFQMPLRVSKGTHLAITSVAGFAPLIHRASYAASKHAMTGFFSCLRAEERLHGVRTLIAAPSFVDTNTSRPETTCDGLSRPGAAQDAFDALTPQQAAKIILRGVRRGRFTIHVGRVAKFSAALMRLSPRLYEWVMALKR